MTDLGILRDYAKRITRNGVTPYGLEPLVRDLLSDEEHADLVAAELSKLLEDPSCPSLDLILVLNELPRIPLPTTRVLVEGCYWVALKSTGIPVSLLERAWEVASANADSLSMFASVPGLSLEVQQWLLGMRLEVCLGLASNSSLDLSIQEELAAMGGERLREVLSGNRFLDDSLVAAFATSEDPDVRAGIAWHPKLADVHALEMARDPDMNIRVELAQYSSSPAVLEVVEQESVETIVLESLVANPHSPRSVVCKVVSDAIEIGEPSERLLSIALHHKVWTQDMFALLYSKGSRFRLLLAESRVAPADVLCEYAQGENPRVQAAAFANHNLTWSPSLPDYPVKKCSSTFLRSVRDSSGVDVESWDALVGGWRGGYLELAEACVLVTRPNSGVYDKPTH